MGEPVVLLGCGDIGPIHEPMPPYSELVRGTPAMPTSSNAIMVCPSIPPIRACPMARTASAALLPKSSSR
jgi:hypothetical protein